ncbi:trypsin-like cysteine/serine peptidase domain-containing protein [Helicostylum pulchrum]|uniref:Peptidase S1 domain-containing protein n=1 Tax=Helicostylum pulchrum TaxID=562976 RepID=A0ABP9Y389_9FUNG|nr:trypsin-like cysteine/serine peptidase domain-containing protein [Helicostylum pulchrum]
MRLIKAGYSRIRSFHLFLLLFAQIASTQVSHIGRYHNYLNSYSTFTHHTLYNIPSPYLNNNQPTLNKPFQFAQSIDVSIEFDISSVATINSDRDWSWKIKIISDGATSLSLIFDQWWIPEHTEVYVYNDKEILGAFTSFPSNKKSKQFATTPIQGDTIILEYYSPIYVKQLPNIRISKVVYGFRPLPVLDTIQEAWKDSTQHIMKRKRRPHSGKCNIDVSCDKVGSIWSKEARAVAVLLTDENQVYCSAVLLNNAKHDGRQLLLTAYHCMGSSNPATDIVMFNHQRRSCNGYHGKQEILSAYSDTLHGLKWLTGSVISDYALLEIEEPIPKDYNVYLAGWTTNQEPVPPLVGIHHPSGDYKKLSIYNGHLLPACWAECPDKDHWKVEHWTRGTTEPGSSGSPLFDASHRIVGQLHGGSASCWNKRGYDVYGSFEASWQNGLSDYLDPNNQTIKTSFGSIGMDGVYLNKLT